MQTAPEQAAASSWAALDGMAAKLLAAADGAFAAVAERPMPVAMTHAQTTVQVLACPTSKGGERIGEWGMRHAPG